MIETLYIVVRVGGLVVGFIGPLEDINERRCFTLAARAQISQPMNGHPIAQFSCEWRAERPTIERFAN